MKKILIAVSALMLLLAGCTAAPAQEPGGKVRVVATIFAPYDFARAVAGDKAELTMLLPPGSETHSFEPTPQDIIQMQSCDVFIYVGGESDEWVSGILDSFDHSQMQVVTLMDCVEALPEETLEGMQAEEEEEDGALDEHVWTSPRNAKLIVEKISQALCEADSENADFYRQNTTDYLARLDTLDAAFRDAVNDAARKTVVFGDRFPFRYFTDAYGLTPFAAFPGCAAETEASAATVKFLIDKVKNEGIPVVFHVELSNEKMADTIAEAAGAKALLLHACHNITKADFMAGKTYLDLMAANVQALKEALN